MRRLQVIALAWLLLLPLAAIPAPSQAQGINALAPVETLLGGLQEAVGVAVALDATTYVSDAGAGVIYQISPAGVVTTAVSALQRPSGLALDLSGRLLIAEETGGRILRVESTGALTVLATGLSAPRWLAVALDGSIYFSDHDPTIPSGLDPTEGRRINRLVPGQSPTVVASGLSQLQGLAALIDGTLVASTMGFQSAPSSTGKLLRYPMNGDGTLGSPTVFLDTGAQQPIGLMQPGQFAVITGLYVAFREASGSVDPTKRGIGKVRMTGTFTSFADHLGDPRGLSLGPDGSLYAADGIGGRLLRFHAPAPPLLDPLPAFTNQSAVTVTGTADPNVRIDVAVVANSTVSTVVTTTSSGTGTFSVSVPLNPNAVNTLAVFATPSGGNGLTSAPTVVTLTHSNLAPGIAWVQPRPGAFVRQTVTLQAQATDGGNGVSSVTFVRDGRTLATLVNPNPAQPFLATTTLDTTTLNDGVHLLTAIALSLAGNSASASATILVDNTPPTAQITGGPTGQITTPTATFTFTGTDNLTPPINLQFAWRLDGGAFSAFSLATTATLNGLTSATHLFEVKARDLAGNESALVGRSFTVQAMPTITSVTPGSGPLGTFVTIAGTLFQPGPTQVSFNGTAAVVHSITATQITTTVPPGATTGSLTVTTPTGTASAPFAVTTTGDFTMAAAPTAARVIAGDQTAISLSAGGSGSFTSVVSLTVSPATTGISAAFSPAAFVAPGAAAFLTLTTASTVAPGTYTFTVTGQAQVDSQTLTRTATFNLQVLASNTLAVTGRVLTAESVPKPIPGATVALGTASTLTDAGGNFVLLSPPTGPNMLLVDGRTGSTPTAQYPFIEANITIAASGPTRVPFIIYLPILDTAHPINLPLDANGFTTQTVQASTPLAPGLILTIPAGTKITGVDGNPVRQITITPVPIDRAPMPFPNGLTPPMLVAIQPGGAVPSQPLPMTFPNLQSGVAGDKADLYYFDVSTGGWRTWGTGTVDFSARTTIVSDPGMGLPRFAWHTPILRNFVFRTVERVRGLFTAGEPVDLPTGRFTVDKTDVVIPGRIPVTIQRTYRSENARNGLLGIGWALSPYEMTIVRLSGGELRLVFPNQSSFPLTPTSTGQQWQISSEPSLLGAVLTQAGASYRLRFKDGTVYTFGGIGGFLNLFGLTSITDRNGNVVTISRDPATNQRIVAITEPAGRSLALSYDTLGRIIAVTDPIGQQVRYDYDAGGRIAAVTDAAGGVTLYTYDGQHRILSITDPRGITFITNTYDANGRVATQTQADGGVWQFAYALQGAEVVQTTVTDPRGNATVYRFGPEGFPLATTDALGQTTNRQYAAGTNLLLSVTDPVGRVARFAYDGQGNVTAVTDAAGNVRTFTYEPTFNRVTSITDPLSNVTQFAYDSNGNLTTITDPLLNRTTIAYNAFGQPTSATDPLLNTTTFTYDGQGNLAAAIDPLGNTTSRQYDGVGRLVRQTDPRGQATVFVYDPLNRVTSLTDALGGATRFSFDPNGNLLTVADARGNAITHTYDAMDRLATRVDGLGATESFAYDTIGNVVRRTDRKGQISTFTYDALNRRTAETYADGSTSSFVYDATGRLVRASDSVGGTIANTYDALDRLLAQATGLGAVSYQYDAVGRRTQMNAPGQASVSYGYDAASRLTAVVQGSQVVNLTYDAAGRRTTLALPNGVTMQYTYDGGSRITALTYKLATTTLGDLQYSYDAEGNRTKVGGAWARTGLPQPLAGASYNANNEQIAFGSQTLTYDLNGNLTSDGANAYTWDARNRLAAITGPVPASFTYDATGRRASKTINGTVISFLYDGVNPIQELAGTAAASLLTGLDTDEYFIRTDTSGASALLTDALGSTVALTDPSGGVQTQYTYEPFGATTTIGAATVNPIGYTGRENDGTGLYYYRARYYHPLLQRFISEDPLGSPIVIHLYAYASNNPISFLDLLGLITWPGQGAVKSKFGQRGGQFAGFHNGADIQNPNDGFVVAADTGVVIPVRQGGRGGNQVGILHQDGSVTIYSHTSPLVKPGDKVQEGQPIGLTDTSGRTTGNHVHFIYYPKGLSHPPADPEQGYLPKSNNYPKLLRR